MPESEPIVRRAARARRALVLCALVAPTLPAGSAPADLFAWNSATGGSFFAESSWNDGESGVPGADDDLLFALDATYAVSVSLAHDGADPHFERLVVRHGDVGFQFFDPQGRSFAFDAALPLAPAFVVGDVGGASARLAVHAGTAYAGPLRAPFVVLGDAPLADGALRIASARRPLEVGDQVEVGRAGTGTLEIAETGRVTAPRVVAGALPGAVGSIDVRGPAATLDVADLLALGRGGAGSLTIAEGASVATARLALGEQLAGTGAATVDGPGSIVTTTQALDVGLFGDALLEVTGGAVVLNLGFTTIGAFLGGDDPAPGEWSEGTLRVAGATSAFWAVGDLALGLGGEARLEILEGAQARVLGDLFSWSPAFEPYRPKIRVVAGRGDFASSPALVVDGAFAPTPSVLIALELADGAPAPPRGTVVRLLRAAGGLDPLDFELALPDLPPGDAWDVMADGTELRVRAVGDPDLDGSGAVDLDDLLIVLSRWGPCTSSCAADLDGDGQVGLGDLLRVLAAWS